MTGFTVFGGTGFIGGHLVRHLRAAGDTVRTPGRDAPLPAGNLGNVVYCIGLTADFRTRPLETIDAHVCRLAGILRHARFESLLYVSSTRVYGRAGAASEDTAIPVDPADPGDLYNISKLAGESLCLTIESPAVRVARLSNVFGAPADGAGMAADNFLTALILEAAATGHIRLRTAPESDKDYVAAEDVARALRRIALHGRHRVYNVASGRNVANGAITGALERILGCTSSVAPGAPTIRFPTLATDRIRDAFADADAPWSPAPLLPGLERLVAHYAPRTAIPAGEMP